MGEKKLADPLIDSQKEVLNVLLRSMRNRRIIPGSLLMTWVLFWAKGYPLDSVGIYVPGGTASYPSSVFMNAIPAMVAGVSEIVMVVPSPRGVVSEAVLGAAEMCGIDMVFSIGGAQAVAALAFGTETVPKVDKIVGPGNMYVAEAKRKLYGTVGVDMVAGPSEIVILCDGTTRADWIAMDLMAQAEHDENAQAILIATEKSFYRMWRKSSLCSLKTNRVQDNSQVLEK